MPDSQTRLFGLSDWAGRLVAASVVAVLVLAPGAAHGGVDENGTLDVVVATVDYQASRLCLGDGSGGFSCTDVGTDARSVALGDVNNDGLIDMVLGRVGPTNLVCLGNGSGGFVCGDVSSDETHTLGTTLGDVNGDGHLDIVFANGPMNRVCLGDGTGGFTCADLNASRRTNDAALGDVNSDGRLDVVFANEGQRNQVCLGDGLGGFSCSDVSTNTDNTIDLALGDYDNDGRLDAVFGGHGGTNEICLGQGNGSFVCGSVSADDKPTFGVAAGDVNGDGALDVVFANEGGRNQVCLGNGTGGFSCSDISNDANQSWDVAIGDVDRDGRLDAVFANFNPPVGQKDRVCFGDGTGKFACKDLSNDVLPSHNLAIAPGHRGTFIDDDFSIFEADIEWLVDQGITQGCTVDGTLYCPDDNVTRGQMAAFLARAFNLPDAGPSPFTDTAGLIFEADIAKVAAAGITQGCNPEGTLFCPNGFVTRGQMAAFLSRALVLPEGAVNTFVDDDGSIFEEDIAKIAQAGITQGCTADGTMFCPDDFVDRGQMAAFIHRAFE